MVLKFWLKFSNILSISWYRSWIMFQNVCLRYGCKTSSKCIFAFLISSKQYEQTYNLEYGNKYKDLMLYTNTRISKCLIEFARVKYEAVCQYFVDITRCSLKQLLNNIFVVYNFTLKTLISLSYIYKLANSHLNFLHKRQELQRT